MEHPELEGTHEDHQVQPTTPHNTPQTQTQWLRVVSQCFLSSSSSGPMTTKGLTALKPSLSLQPWMELMFSCPPPALPGWQLPGCLSVGVWNSWCSLLGPKHHALSRVLHNAEGKRQLEKMPYSAIPCRCTQRLWKSSLLLLGRITAFSFVNFSMRKTQCIWCSASSLHDSRYCRVITEKISVGAETFPVCTASSEQRIGTEAALWRTSAQ